MDIHHQRKRDPNWSPHGCNICGKEGHQAAACNSGSIDWVDRFGLDTFVPKRPYYDIKPREVPDYAKIEEAARLYAKTKELATQNVDTKSAGEKFQQELQRQEQEKRQAQAQEQQQQQVNSEDKDLPPGWRSYTAPNGKTYYHKAATNTTQWKKPTE